MTAKQKAAKLVSKFKEYAYANIMLDDDAFNRQLLENAKKCALICVEEILNEPSYQDSGSIFYQQVKNEIKAL